MFSASFTGVVSSSWKADEHYCKVISKKQYDVSRVLILLICVIDPAAGQYQRLVEG